MPDKDSIVWNRMLVWSEFERNDYASNHDDCLNGTEGRAEARSFVS